MNEIFDIVSPISGLLPWQQRLFVMATRMHYGHTQNIRHRQRLERQNQSSSATFLTSAKGLSVRLETEPTPKNGRALWVTVFDRHEVVFAVVVTKTRTMMRRNHYPVVVQHVHRTVLGCKLGDWMKRLRAAHDRTIFD